jgi:hypothetical protein
LEGYKSFAGKMVTSLYVTSWIFLGNFVLLNLFLAILLDSFTTHIYEKEQIFISEDDDDLESKSSDRSIKVNIKICKYFILKYFE